MLIRHRGAAPTVDPTAYVAPTATLVGDVRIDPRSRIMYGAVLDAEASHIQVGEACVIAENAVLRATAVARTGPARRAGRPCLRLSTCDTAGLRGGRCAYIATGATVLHGARLGAGSCVAVGALVHARTGVGDEVFVGPHTIAVGDPLRILTPDQQDEVASAIRAVNFAGAAFGIPSTWDDRIGRYEQIAEVRVAEFGAHVDDKLLG